MPKAGIEKGAVTHSRVLAVVIQKYTCHITVKEIHLSLPADNHCHDVMMLMVMMMMMMVVVTTAHSRPAARQGAESESVDLHASKETLIIAILTMTMIIRMDNCNDYQHYHMERWLVRAKRTVHAFIIVQRSHNLKTPDTPP